MSTLADRTIAALRANHDALAQVVRASSSADLDRQSGAGNWTVAQVLSHLGSGAEIMLATLGAATTGVDERGADFNQSVWDHWNSMSQQQQANNHLKSGAELVAALEALDGPQRAELKIDLGFLPYPVDVAGFAGMRLSEATHHSWDVRVAFDENAVLAADEAAVLIDQLTGPIAFLLGFAGKIDALDGREVTLRVETTAPDRVLGLELGEAIRLAEAPSTADGVLSAPAEAVLRLIAGRLAHARTPAGVALSGNAVQLDQLRRVFPGF